MASLLRRSLTLRLALVSAGWAALTLSAAGWLILDAVGTQLTRNFDIQLLRTLNRVAGAATLDAEGRVALATPLPQAGYDQPYSGFYWQLAAPGGGRKASPSLVQAALPLAEGPPDRPPQARNIAGPRGERLRLALRMVQPAGAAQPLSVSVAMPRDALEEDITSLRLLVTTAFVVIGLGLVVGGIAQVTWAIRPLRRSRDALAEVSAGRQDRLSVEEAPAEIAVLIEEINTLVDQNRRTVERARSYVGNLAHALRTPLAIQRAALDGTAPDRAQALAQNQMMDRLVQHHLTRARASALSGVAAVDAAPHAVAQDMAAAFRRLFAEKQVEITLEGDPALRVKVDRQDLEEMLGNLMENACKWARRKVAVTMRPQGDSVVIAVADDGPGLDKAEQDAALARGVRLDEAAPGNGLGLAIARDLAELYEGQLAMDSPEGGGLRVALRLPRR